MEDELLGTEEKKGYVLRLDTMLMHCRICYISQDLHSPLSQYGLMNINAVALVGVVLKMLIFGGQAVNICLQAVL